MQNPLKATPLVMHATSSAHHPLMHAQLRGLGGLPFIPRPLLRSCGCVSAPYVTDDPADADAAAMSDAASSHPSSRSSAGEADDVKDALTRFDGICRWDTASRVSETSGGRGRVSDDGRGRVLDDGCSRVSDDGCGRVLDGGRGRVSDDGRGRVSDDGRGRVTDDGAGSVRSERWTLRALRGSQGFEGGIRRGDVDRDEILKVDGGMCFPLGLGRVKSDLLAVGLRTVGRNPLLRQLAGRWKVCLRLVPCFGCVRSHVCLSRHTPTVCLLRL